MLPRGRYRTAGGIFCWTLVALVMGRDASIGAAEPDAVATPSSAPSQSDLETLSMTPSQARASAQWLASLALRKLPATFDGEKDWGDTTRLWSGVKIRRDGWRVKTHRRFREVEHGRWVRYQVMMPDSGAASAPTLTVDRAAPETDPRTSLQRWRIESSIVTPMRFTVRVQRWNLGVRIYSVTVTGHMRLRMTSSASVGFLADYREIPPALVIDPRIDRATLELERFEVDRVSNIGGDVAEQWGELVEEILVDRFVRRQNERIVTKLNRSIDKERDELRLSLADWLATW